MLLKKYQFQFIILKIPLIWGFEIKLKWKLGNYTVNLIENKIMYIGGKFFKLY